MNNEQNLYNSGLALIMEGATEKFFYLEILRYICKKHNITISKEKFDSMTLLEYYELSKDNVVILLNIKNAETITQMTNQFEWFKNFCADKHPKINWNVFLCYDTDGNSISIFHESDWNDLRTQINKFRNVNVLVDCRANMDIEDIFLIDIDGIKKFLGISKNTEIVLRGKKGKAKLKNLYNDYAPDKRYHEGKRALPLIQSLNLQKIINDPSNNIDDLEKIVVSVFNKKQHNSV